MDKPKLEKGFLFELTAEEWQTIHDLAGGKKEMRNFLRRAIRDWAKNNGVDLPENQFVPRKQGNWGKGVAPVAIN